MSRVTRTDDITCTVRDEVLRGQYRAGERLPSERELAARFETTRGVARIALKRLEQMGVVEVQPGGARVKPIGESSLEVVGHLIQLESPPDPVLVDQALEVVGALVAANMRMAIERGQPEHLSRVEKLIEQMEQPGLEAESAHGLLHDFAHVFMDATDNLVMRIVRRELRTEGFARLQESARDIEVPEEARSELLVGLPEILPHLKAISVAVETRDGLAGYEAVHQMWTRFRAHVRERLEAARETVPEARALGEAV